MKSSHRPNGKPIKVKMVYFCQVYGCNTKLSNCKPYCVRYRVCQAHLQASSVQVDGAECRFCQQCGKFHPLDEFDGSKRSCRARLLHHNSTRMQRRKQALQQLADSTSTLLVLQQRRMHIMHCRSGKDGDSPAAPGNVVEASAGTDDAVEAAAGMAACNGTSRTSPSTNTDASSDSDGHSSGSCEQQQQLQDAVHGDGKDNSCNAACSRYTLPWLNQAATVAAVSAGGNEASPPSSPLNSQAHVQHLEVHQLGRGPAGVSAAASALGSPHCGALFATDDVLAAAASGQQLSAPVSCPASNAAKPTPPTAAGRHNRFPLNHHPTAVDRSPFMQQLQQLPTLHALGEPAFTAVAATVAEDADTVAAQTASAAAAADGSMLLRPARSNTSISTGTASAKVVGSSVTSSRPAAAAAAAGPPVASTPDLRATISNYSPVLSSHTHCPPYVHTSGLTHNTRAISSTNSGTHVFNQMSHRNPRAERINSRLAQQHDGMYTAHGAGNGSSDICPPGQWTPYNSELAEAWAGRTVQPKQYTEDAHQQQCCASNGYCSGLHDRCKQQQQQGQQHMQYVCAAAAGALDYQDIGSCNTSSMTQDGWSTGRAGNFSSSMTATEIRATTAASLGAAFAIEDPASATPAAPVSTAMPCGVCSVGLACEASAHWLTCHLPGMHGCGHTAPMAALQQQSSAATARFGPSFQAILQQQLRRSRHSCSGWPGAAPAANSAAAAAVAAAAAAFTPDESGGIMQHSPSFVLTVDTSTAQLHAAAVHSRHLTRLLSLAGHSMEGTFADQASCKHGEALAAAGAGGSSGSSFAAYAALEFGIDNASTIARPEENITQRWKSLPDFGHFEAPVALASDAAGIQDVLVARLSPVAQKLAASKQQLHLPQLLPREVAVSWCTASTPSARMQCCAASSGVFSPTGQIPTTQQAAVHKSAVHESAVRELGSSVDVHLCLGQSLTPAALDADSASLRGPESLQYQHQTCPLSCMMPGSLTYGSLMRPDRNSSTGAESLIPSTQNSPASLRRPGAGAAAANIQAWELNESPTTGNQAAGCAQTPTATGTMISDYPEVRYNVPAAEAAGAGAGAGAAICTAAGAPGPGPIARPPSTPPGCMFLNGDSLGSAAQIDTMLEALGGDEAIAMDLGLL